MAEGEAEASDPWGDVVEGIRGMIRDGISAHAAAHATTDLVGGRVDLLGKVLDRLPDSLSVAEVCLLLDRFDVALRGHESSPSLGAASVLPPAASDPIVGDASGTGGVPPVPVPDAPSSRHPSPEALIAQTKSRLAYGARNRNVKREELVNGSRDRLSGRHHSGSAQPDATWVWFEAGATRLRVVGTYFAGPPLLKGHIRAEGDVVEIRNMTVFSGRLTHWAAVRWGLFGILRMGVIRRDRVRALFHIGRRSKGRAS